MKESVQINLLGRVPMLQFSSLNESGLVTHGFTTRDGGASQGPYGSMNLSFTMGDREDRVRENFSRVGDALGVSTGSMVSVWQAHTDRIKVVRPEDRGKGISMDKEQIKWDGLVTDCPGITLVTLHADCLPVFFLDPVHHAIGLVHSGWRGTRKAIGIRALEVMETQYGTVRQDVIACIGPGICSSCFEVGPEVAYEFQAMLGPAKAGRLISETGGGKFLLDLAGINRDLLLEYGILPGNLSMAGLCTRCRPDLFFSHRRDGEIRGSMAAFLALL